MVVDKLIIVDMLAQLLTVLAMSSNVHEWHQVLLESETKLVLSATIRAGF